VLAQLKDLLRPIRLTDPVFGRIRFLRDARFWEGNCPFPPAGKDVEVLIHAAQTGPSAGQRELFLEIAERYGDLSQVLLPDLRTYAKASGIEATAFQVVCISMLEEPAIELTFEPERGGDQFDVRIADGKVLSIEGPR
jgi:hypothetical protein